MEFPSSLPNHRFSWKTLAVAVFAALLGLIPALALFLLEEQAIGVGLLTAWLLCVFVLFTINWGKRDIWISYFVVSIYLFWWLAAAFLTNLETGSRDYLLVWLGLRGTAMAAGIPLFLFFALKAGASVIQGRATWRARLHDLDWATLALAALAPLGLLMGLLHGNSLILVIGDVYGYLLVPLVYYVAKKTISPEHLFKFWKWVLTLMIFVALFRVMRFTVSYLGGGAFVTGGSIAWLIPIIFFPLAFFYIERGRVWHAVLYFLSLVVITFTFARELWAVALLSVPLIFVLIPKSRMVVRAALVAVFAGILGIASVNLPPLNQAFPQLQRAIISRFQSALNPGQILGPGSARRADIEGSLGTISAFEFWAGKGAGAEYDHPFYRRVEHHIHMTPVSVFFRTGLIGLILFVGFMLIALLKALKLSRASGLSPPLRVIAMTAVVYFLLSGLDSLLTYGVVNDIFWGFFLGSLAVIHRHLRKGAEPCAESPVS